MTASRLRTVAPLGQAAVGDALEVEPMIVYAAGALLAGYVLGSIPFGVLVARAYGNVDLTAQGSGRTGATNVLRTLGPLPAAVVFAGDLLKGVGAVVLARTVLGGDAWLELLAAIGAVVGHTYSPFISFKGGRGVVTGLGATLVAVPQALLVGTLVGVAAIAATRYVSLGSILGTVVTAALVAVLGIASGQVAWVLWGLLVGGFIVVAHRDNLQRLLSGTERKLGERPERA